ncbi:DNA methyltransferase [[Bacillus] sp. KCTC 13219]|nr:DNA methyltransferase [[Bacillus] sp. KCTC 13219]
MPKYKTISLFGGIAADDKAWLELGIDTKKIDYVEIQPNRVRAYNALNPFRYKPQDVRGWNLKCDVLVHGSPCQSFSRVGLREGGKKDSGTQSSLMFETLRIVEEMGLWKPKFVVWENVKGVLDKTLRQPFEQYLSEMERLGYTNNYEVLDARDFGIPHARERVFCISVLGNEEFDFDKLERVPMRHINEFLEYGYNDKVPEQYLITIPSMLNKIAEINPVKPTDTYKRRLDEIVDYCYTITERQDRCPNAGYIKCKQGYRYLTELEVCRLLGYSDSDFKKLLKEFPSKPGKRNATIYALFGNSIVVDVLKAIFQLIESGNYAKEIKSAKQLQLIC